MFGEMAEKERAGEGLSRVRDREMRGKWVSLVRFVREEEKQGREREWRGSVGARERERQKEK
jgi:hypothetical protein